MKIKMIKRKKYINVLICKFLFESNVLLIFQDINWQQIIIMYKRVIIWDLYIIRVKLQKKMI
jgi:hypothetical protein